MFDVQILGMDMYRILHTFVLFSFLGYLMECVVLSIEKKRLVLDRGFMKGPFCIIYGFGALIIPALLRPFSHNLFLLFAAGMLLATVLEYLTGIAMMRLFGSLWWDYSHKAFNYRGMVCLESSLAWGLLGLFFFYVLDSRVRTLVIRIPGNVGNMLAVGLTVFYLVDFIHCLRLRMGGMEEEEPVIGRLKVY